MKRRQVKIQHIIQFSVTLMIIILVNYIGSKLYLRFDLTSDKRYTLSEMTHQVLNDLENVVFIKVYLDGDLPAGFVRLKNAIQELLDECRWQAPGKIDYEFIDPNEDPDPRVQRGILTQLYEKGLQPTNVQVKQKDGSTTQKIIFPGAIISYGGIDVAVNLLKNNPGISADVNLNNSIQSLEYEFTNMIRNLASDTITKVAFIEGHGELDQYETGDITKELANFYQVDRGVIGGTYGCLDEYKAVIIAKPERIFEEGDKFVIDQYIMYGGKVLWLIDAARVSLDSLLDGSTFAFYNPVNLEDQLFRYGVRINPDLAGDIQCHVIPVNKGLAGGQPSWQLSPWYYFPIIAPPGSHPITRNLNVLRLEFASVIDTVGEDPNIQKTILLTTSPYTKVVNLPLEISLRETDKKPDKRDFNKSFQPVAVLLEGRFESAFTNRPVPDITSDGPVKVEIRSIPTKMIVVSDGDIIRNDVSVSPGGGPVIIPLGYDKYTSQYFGNKDFILNAINYLTDESGLIRLRGREFKLRLLDRKKIMEEEVKWKLINMICPLIIVILLGVGINIYRERIYG